MYELLAESISELAAILFFAFGTSALSTLGVYLEELAAETFAAGEVMLGLWFAGFGLMAFYFGLYLFGYGELLPRIRTILGSSGA